MTTTRPGDDASHNRRAPGVAAPRGRAARSERANAAQAPAFRRSLLWSLGLLILAPLSCFLVSTIYVYRWAARLDADALSIATNGAPSVLYLSTARKDSHLIERRATLAQPGSLAADRAAIAALRADYDHAVAVYRTTEDYPGEREAWEIMREQSTRFFDAVEDTLAAVNGDAAEQARSLARLQAAEDGLSADISTVLQINADETSKAGREIEALRVRAGALATGRDVLAFLCTMAGAWIGLAAARQRIALVEERSRLHEERAAELDIFAGRVAHDLRTPLTAIHLRCLTAARQDAPDRLKDALARILHQEQRMNEIIDTLLAFARAGAHPTPGSRCESAAVAREVVAEAQPLAAEAHVDLVVAPLEPAPVACDPNVLGVVLSNLVRNAIKYMGNGSDGVRRITLRNGAEEDALRFEVEDTGPGLPAGTEAKVFDPFVRLAAAPKTGGIGLGLATVKRLVEAHRGRVGVTSRPGHGCCFWFTLPTAASPPPPGETKRASAA